MWPMVVFIIRFRIVYNQSVIIHVYSKKIEVYDSIGNRIAFRSRRYFGKRYVTATEHMPENHKDDAEFNNFDGTYYRQKAARIGNNAYKFVYELLDSADVEEQAVLYCCN